MEKTKIVDINPGLSILPINDMDLYRVEILTDDKAGQIKWYIPITKTGEQDLSRAYKFRGLCVINTPVGPKSLEFPVFAYDLSNALLKWPRALEAAIQRFQDEVETARKRALLEGRT